MSKKTCMLSRNAPLRTIRGGAFCIRYHLLTGYRHLRPAPFPDQGYAPIFDPLLQSSISRIQIREAVKKWLISQNFPVQGGVCGRFLLPEGWLFKFGASGVYWPFVGEAVLEHGLHPLRKMPALAHEMSHGYGFCDEGVCNFIAYAACSEHPTEHSLGNAKL